MFILEINKKITFYFQRGFRDGGEKLLVVFYRCLLLLCDVVQRVKQKCVYASIVSSLT